MEGHWKKKKRRKKRKKKKLLRVNETYGGNYNYMSIFIKTMKRLKRYTCMTVDLGL
jgi:hypothetical protein